MRAPVAVAVAVGLALAAVAFPAAAHGNHLSADPQVSTDGRLVVEGVLSTVDAWVVIRTDDGGRPGDPLGHAPVDGDDGFWTDVRVAIDGDAWANWTGPRTVWVVLHADDGDGAFDSDDEMLASFGDPVGDRIAVGKGDAPAYVTVERFAPQPSNGTVAVRAAALPREGYVVVRNATGDGPGAVVGATALPAGTHGNVTVDLDRSFYRDRDGRFALWAAVYADDGDGTFDDGDAPVRVGDRAAATTFAVNKTGEPSPTPADDNGSGGDHEHGETVTGHGHSTPTATVTASPTPEGDATDSPTAAGAAGTTGGPSGTTAGDAPGFGLAVAAVALAAAAAVARARRQ